MAEKKIPVKIDTGASLQQLRELKKELKLLAAGTDEFNQKAAQIRDVEDNLEAAKIGAEDFAGALEAAPGPIGQLARGMKTLEINTKSFNTAWRAAGIGILVSLVAGLVAAFTNSERAMKKLEPVMEAFQKILGGIFAAFEPVLDVFIEMVEYVLPYFTQLIGGVYSTLFGFFTLIKENVVGVGKLLTGLFTLDADLIAEGIEQVKGSISSAVDSGLEAYERFEKGTEELTEKEKEELAKQEEARKEAEQKRKEAREKALKEEEDRLKAYQSLLEKYLDEEENLLATTEQEKLDLEKKRAQEELNALKLTEEERAKLQAQFDEVYRIKQEQLNKDIAAREEQRRLDILKKEQGYQNELDKLRASQTESLIDDTELEVSITTQKYNDLIAAAIANNESTILLEKLKEEELAKIRKDGELKEDQRLKAEADKRRQDLIAGVDDELKSAQEKIAIRASIVDSISQLASQETAIGKAAFVAQQILRLADLKATATAALEKLAIDSGQATADVATGAAATLKAGLPKAIPLLIAYAAQAAAITASIVKAFGKAKSAASSVQGGGNTSAPSTPQPIGVVARRNQGGFVFGDGGSITDSIPTMLSNGEFVMNARSAELFSPMLMAMNNMGNLPNTAIPQALGNQSLVDVVNQTANNRPIKTYVTAQDMSNQQQFDRTIKSRSLI